MCAYMHIYIAILCLARPAAVRHGVDWALPECAYIYVYIICMVNDATHVCGCGSLGFKQEGRVMLSSFLFVSFWPAYAVLGIVSFFSLQQTFLGGDLGIVSLFLFFFLLFAS